MLCGGGEQSDYDLASTYISGPPAADPPRARFVPCKDTSPTRPISAGMPPKSRTALAPSHARATAAKGPQLRASPLPATGSSEFRLLTSF